MKYQIKKIIPIVIILILSIIACSTYKWSIDSKTVNGNTLESDIGLWKICAILTGTKGTSDLTCYDMTNKIEGIPDSKYLKMVKILSILGISTLFLSLILSITNIKSREYSVICLLLSGIFLITAAILWSVDNKLNGKAYNILGYDFKHGYSWYLELISGILSILIGGLIQFNILE